MTPMPSAAALTPTLPKATELLWNKDCGILPLVERGNLAGIITGRPSYLHPVRGLAHIDVAKVLSEIGIRPAITGTNAGSLIGAMLAAGMDWSEIASLARKTFWPKLLHGEMLEGSARSISRPPSLT